MDMVVKNMHQAKRFPRTYTIWIHSSILLLLLGRLLARQIPVVQVSNASAEVGGKAQPAEVWDLAPSGNRVNGAVEVRQVAIDSNEGDNINRCLNGTVEAKEKRGPEEVEAELDAVESHGLSSGTDGIRGGKGREANVGSSICGVTHDTRNG